MPRETDHLSPFEIRQEVRRLQAQRNRTLDTEQIVAIQADIEALRAALVEREIDKVANG